MSPHAVNRPRQSPPAPWLGTLRPVLTPPAGIPIVRPFDWEADTPPDPTMRSHTGHFSQVELDLLLEACAAGHMRKPMRAWVDLAAHLRNIRNAGATEADPTPAHGTPRPR